jgi:predicted RNase H-like HicB family nuclease
MTEESKIKAQEIKLPFPYSKNNLPSFTVVTLSEYAGRKAIQTSTTIPLPIQSENTTQNLTPKEIPVFHQENISFHYEIKDLIDGYSFLYPITIEIKELKDDGIFVSECSTLNLYAQGETYDESIDEMKSLIVDDYLAFLKDYPDRLTDDAISILRLYCALFGEDLPS